MDTFPPNAIALAAWNPAKSNPDGSTGGWELINGASGAASFSDVSPKAEQQQQVFSFTGTGTALGQTSNIAGYGFAFQIFKFTKSAAVNNAVVRLCINGRGVAFLDVTTTTETIAVTAIVDGTNETASPLAWRKSDGTLVTALGTGTYTLPVQ